MLELFARLRESVPDLIKLACIKHREIWQEPVVHSRGLHFRKDTFYRRLCHHDWTWEEMATLIPFLLEKIRVNNPTYYNNFIKADFTQPEAGEITLQGQIA